MTEPTERISRYYDLLYWWADKITDGRAFEQAGPHTIHRALAHPKTGEVRTDTIHEFIRDTAARLAPIDALDAGCGYGGVALELHRMLGGRFHGITINETQISLARRSAAALGRDREVTFELASYDAPLGRSFNLIYGIESLIHSPAPDRTIANLARALAPGGLLLIIDDMPVDDLPAASRADVDEFKRRWHCPVMPSASQWRSYCETAGLVIDGERDLSALVRPRSEAEVVAALAEYRAAEGKRIAEGLGLVTDAEIGGVLLERLIRVGAVRYVMITARRPA